MLLISSTLIAIKSSVLCSFLMVFTILEEEDKCCLIIRNINNINIVDDEGKQPLMIQH